MLSISLVIGLVITIETIERMVKMRILKVSGFLLFNLVVLKLFSTADNRGQDNNPEGLPSDVTHVPGGGTFSGETIPKAGDPGSLEPLGTKSSEQRGGLPKETPAAQDEVGNLGWSATGTPGDGGEIGQQAHDQKA